ncbi:MAG: hypothetical protein ACE5LA_04935 [Dehalococcoidales bacterium]
MELNRNRSITIKIAILWLAILLLGSFWLTLKTSSDMASLVVLPKVPREGEPVIATLKLNNPSSRVTSVSYQLYTNGELMREGIATLPPSSSRVYQFAYKNPLPLGEQINFLVRASTSEDNYEQIISLPSYPPQVWSSFVSFASFSTSLMSSLVSMSYYQSTFGSQISFNMGVLFTLVLAALLIFLELSQPLLQQRTITVLGRLRLRFSTVTWILFIIFLGIFYTSVAMLITNI